MRTEFQSRDSRGTSDTTWTARSFIIEGFFANLTRKRLRRGPFNSVAKLKKAIVDFIDARNLEPKPFVWTATAE